MLKDIVDEVKLIKVDGYPKAMVSGLMPVTLVLAECRRNTPTLRRSSRSW